MKPSQTNQILAHLQSGGSITPLEALERFGCLRLGARILDLRNAGHCINSELVHDQHTGKRYARYSLVRSRENAA